MTFEEALEKWIRSHRVVPESFEITHCKVLHEEGWSSDSGTHWPAEVTVECRMRNPALGPKQRGKLVRIYAGSDPIEFMRELFDA